MPKEQNFVKRLLMPVGKQATERKVWSIPLESVWMPFFIATNVEGCTAISPEALGCPLRLGYAKDGSVKFSQSGKPVIRVAKEVSDNVRIVRENFTATLLAHAESVKSEQPENWDATVAANVKAGNAVANVDRENLSRANAARLEKALADNATVPEKELVGVS
jgi:hypothetical protein